MTNESLRTVVAEFFETDPAQVGPGFVLGGPKLHGSVARHVLDAAIRRRLGVKVPAVYSAATYGELEASALGAAPEAAPIPSSNGNGRAAPVPPPSPSRAAPAAPAGLSCGIDVELVENLPATDDPWTHPFYQTCFTPAEIAYCLTQENPRVHFAGRWCVKEALKKCDGAFLHEEMSAVEVARDPSGAVFLRRPAGEALPFAVSLSHTELMAAAIVARVDRAPIEPVMKTPDRAPASPAPSEAPPSSLSSRSGRSAFLPLFALITAIAALTAAVMALIQR
jgi:holo-[acyl-carrier protein] synthase